jgi:hypothetical protein
MDEILNRHANIPVFRRIGILEFMDWGDEFLTGYDQMPDFIDPRSFQALRGHTFAEGATHGINLPAFSNAEPEILGLKHGVEDLRLIQAGNPGRAAGLEVKRACGVSRPLIGAALRDNGEKILSRR